MQCVKCGRELDEGTLFCPVCGEKVPGSSPGNDAPLYQTEVKGLLKSGRLIVYGDRTEFVVSKVQKMVFPYESLAALKKGLDRINFIMEDGKTESCAVNRKDLHKAFFTIEQASRPYIERRGSQLQSEGIRYSFPSSPSGLGGMLSSSGILNILDDRSEFITSSGKNEIISYEDVKNIRLSAMGTLEYIFYDGTRKSFAVGKEIRDDVVSFLQTALLPYIKERKERLLSQGIYFSFLNGQGFSRREVNLYADHLECRSESGQEDRVAYGDIRAVSVSDGTLETALTDGTAKTFFIDRDAQSDVLAFLKEAIAPYVEKRTKGFDLCFGAKERLEINGERGVFHIIRQGGREISGEYDLKDIVKAEVSETKASQNIVGALLASRSADSSGKNTEDKITDVTLLLTVCSEQDTEELPVCLGSFVFGVSRSSAEYGRCEMELTGFFAYMEEHYPECLLIQPVPEEETELPLKPAGEPEPALPAPEESGAQAADSEGQRGADAAAGNREKERFGTLLRGISDFVERCDTPMTIAIQGDGEAGSGGFLRVVYHGLEEKWKENVLCLYAQQLFRNGGWVCLP